MSAKLNLKLNVPVQPKIERLIEKTDEIEDISID